MARPIKETPILFGEEGRRFEEKMRNVKVTETREQYLDRMNAYHAMLDCLKRGEEDYKRRSAAVK